MTTTEAKNVFTRYEERYGKLAFGVITLVIIWYIIVQPMQTASVIIATKTAETTASLARVSDNIERLAPYASRSSHP